MSRLATPSRRPGRQAGQSLVSAILITSVVAMLVTASLMWSKASSGQAARSARADIATQAAEAGIQQYVSRIIESRRYWGLYVDPAEDPRISTSSGAQVNPGQPWANGDKWTYSGPSTTWKSLQDARFGNASYSLRVYPLNGGTALRGNTSGLRVQSTARVQTSANAEPVYTSVVAAISPLSLAHVGGGGDLPAEPGRLPDGVRRIDHLWDHGHHERAGVLQPEHLPHGHGPR